jgi:hypothetical protein
MGYKRSCQYPTSVQRSNLFPTSRNWAIFSNLNFSCSATLASFGNAIPPMTVWNFLRRSSSSSARYNSDPMPLPIESAPQVDRRFDRVAVSASPIPFARVTKALKAFVLLPNKPRQTLHSFVDPLTHLIYSYGLLSKMPKNVFRPSCLFIKKISMVSHSCSHTA